MAHQKDTSLSDAVAANVTKAEMDSIISEAAANGVVGRSLHETLILSGVALGVDALARFTIAAIHTQIKEMRKAISLIGDAIEESGASDDVIAWGRKTRESLVEHVQRQIDLVLGQQAIEIEKVVGVPKELLLSGKPVSELPQQDLASLGTTIAVDNGMSLYGFASHTEPEKMDCGCIDCLARHLLVVRNTPSTSIAAGVVKYGSVEGLMAAFASHTVAYYRSKLESFEDEYGTAHALTDEAAASTTSQILSQFTFHGDRKDGASGQ